MQIWIPLMTITPEYIDTHETWMAVEKYAPLAYYSFNKDQAGYWLDNLWVLPEHMGQGIGKALFKHMLQRCKSMGISTLKIEADPHAQSFYERMGAAKVSEHHTKIADEDRVLPIMEIKL